MNLGGVATCKKGIGVQLFVIFQSIATLAVSLPKGPFTPYHNSSPSNFHQGTVFTRASKVDHLLEKLFKYWTWCPGGGGGCKGGAGHHLLPVTPCSRIGNKI